MVYTWPSDGSRFIAFFPNESSPGGGENAYFFVQSRQPCCRVRAIWALNGLVRSLDFTLSSGSDGGC